MTDIMTFESCELYAGRDSRIGDTVIVMAPNPYPSKLPYFAEEHYMLTSYCKETDEWTGELIDYVELAKTRIRKQVYF